MTGKIMCHTYLHNISKEFKSCYSTCWPNWQH